MNPPTPTSVIITNIFARPINSANTGAGANNPDGSFNASGTIIGGLQTAHSMVDFALTDSGIGPRIIPGVGAALGVFSPRGQRHLVF